MRFQRFLEAFLEGVLQGFYTKDRFQQFRRVTSIGSLPPKTLGKSRGPPQNPAETPQNPRRDSAEPSERPSQSPLRGKFPRRASRRVVPLGWSPSGTLKQVLLSQRERPLSCVLRRMVSCCHCLPRDGDTRTQVSNPCS